MALINTIEEVQEVLQISSLNEVSSLPDFDTAEALYIAPVLGSVYATLVNAYTTNNLPALLMKLLKKVQKPLAAFAYIDSAGLMSVVFTDTGVRQVSTADMPAAYKWQYNAAVDSLKTKAYNAQEDLFRFLEENKAALAWDNKDRRKTLITNGLQFSDHYTLFQPLRTFFLLRPIVKKVEDLYVKDLVGSAYLNELRQQASYTADESDLVEYLRLAIAHLTIKHAIESMPSRKSDAGFTVLNSGFDKDALDSNQSVSPDALLASEKAAAERDGQEYLKKARRLLNTKASATVFKTYFESDLHTPVSTVEKGSRNAGKKTFRF